MPFSYGRLRRGYGAAIVLHLVLHGPTLALAQDPTFTMGSNGYVSTPTTTPELGADDVSILENEGQIAVTFGTEWSKRIQGAVDTNCVDAHSSQCQEQVKQVLGMGATPGGLQSRMLGLVLLGGAALANVVAMIIMMSHEPVMQATPVQVQLPKEVNEAVSNWDNASGNATVQPLEGEPFGFDMVGYMPPSTPASESIPSATINEAGDLVLSVGDLAPVIMDGINSALCPRQAEGRMSARCFANKVLRLMRLAENGGPAQRFQFTDVFNLPQPLGNILEDPNAVFEGPQGTLVQETYSETTKTSNNMLLRPDANKEMRGKIRQMSNTIVFAQGIGGFTFVDGEMVVSKKFWEEQIDWEADDEDEEGCPTGAKSLMFCDSCGGNAVSNDPSSSRQEPGKCIGRNDRTPTYEGCACGDGKVYREDMDTDIQQALQRALQPAKVKNKALSIILENESRESENYRWVFYEVEQGQKAGCTTQKTVVFKGPTFQGASIISPGNPGGEYDMVVWGRGCKYRNNGENAGALQCDRDTYNCVHNGDNSETTPCPGGRIEHEGVYCEFDSDGPASTPDWQPGTCSFSLWQEFSAPILNGGPVAMRFEDVKDNRGIAIGGAWGNSAGNDITDGQVINILSKLPTKIDVKVSRYTPPSSKFNEYINSMTFNFTYGEDEWSVYQETPPDTSPGVFQQSCKTTYPSGKANGYRLAHECKFSC